jgi:hypothetical protein
VTNDERLKNPLNIEVVHGQNWVGQSAIALDPVYVTFDTPEACYRAGRRILRNYEKAGIVTLAGAITRYSPPPKNDTDAYIRHLMQFTGWSRGTPYSRSYLMMLKGMTDHEQGRILYPDSVIAAGIAMEEQMTESYPVAPAAPQGAIKSHIAANGHLYAGGGIGGSVAAFLAYELQHRAGITLDSVELLALGTVLSAVIAQLFPKGVPGLQT